MELELWADLSQAICDVRRGLAPRPRDTHPTATIVRVHLWAALHDRPTSRRCAGGRGGPTSPPASPRPEWATARGPPGLAAWGGRGAPAERRGLPPAPPA